MGRRGSLRAALAFLMLLAPGASVSAQHEPNEHPPAAPHEGSGTSWLPASSPMESIHFASERWSFMLDGFVNLVYQGEREPRGDTELFSTNMMMLGGERSLGSGRFRFRVMASLEPSLGKEGYPLLLQTGESADGMNPLFDRQHPHDLLMEAAVSYQRPVWGGSFFVYFAPVGEPAIGPSAFVHRFSASDNPVAPLSHHWLDGTHISHGVLTFGFTSAGKLKLEASAFNGQEPDAERWDIDSFALDSLAARVSFAPNANWALQVSAAKVSEPDRLHPRLDVIRFTASATHNRPLALGNWQTTLAYGRNDTERLTAPPDSLPPGVHIHFTPGVSPVQHAVLVETDWRFRNRHAVFGRFEWAEKNELFLAADRRHDLVYDVGKTGLGYVFDFVVLPSFRIGAGGYGAALFVPSDLEFVYGKRPFSWGVFVRMKIV